MVFLNLRGQEAVNASLPSPGFRNEAGASFDICWTMMAKNLWMTPCWS